MKTQYITDEKGNIVSIVIPVDEYKRILEELEELEDIHLYDKVKSRKEKSIPFDSFLKVREKKGKYA
ncbi:MAG: hypothetical protein KBC43_07825 [Bacteroidales bacterium]|nr:hypothetical protein [Bacteroidales bacterium]HPI86819.1 hypothetical protein [Bacteroidales bacterium]